MVCPYDCGSNYDINMAEFEDTVRPSEEYRPVSLTTPFIVILMHGTFIGAGFLLGYTIFSRLTATDSRR